MKKVGRKRFDMCEEGCAYASPLILRSYHV